MTGNELLDKDVAQLLRYLSWADYYATQGPADKQCEQSAGSWKDWLLHDTPNPMKQVLSCERANDVHSRLFGDLLAGHIKKMETFLKPNYRYSWCCAPKLESLLQMLFKLGKPRSRTKGPLWPDADQLAKPFGYAELYVGLVASVQLAIIDARSDFRHC